MAHGVNRARKWTSMTGSRCFDCSIQGLNNMIVNANSGYTPREKLRVFHSDTVQSVVAFWERIGDGATVAND